MPFAQRQLMLLWYLRYLKLFGPIDGAEKQWGPLRGRLGSSIDVTCNTGYWTLSLTRGIQSRIST